MCLESIYVLQNITDLFDSYLKACSHFSVHPIFDICFLFPIICQTIYVIAAQQLRVNILQDIGWVLKLYISC